MRGPLGFPKPARSLEQPARIAIIRLKLKNSLKLADGFSVAFLPGEGDALLISSGKGVIASDAVLWVPSRATDISPICRRPSVPDSGLSFAKLSSCDMPLALVNLIPES